MNWKIKKEYRRRGELKYDNCIFRGDPRLEGADFLTG